MRPIGATTVPSSRRWRRRWALLALFLLLLGLLYGTRFALLGAAGRFLVRSDALARADAIYVLGGAPVERGMEGARLLAEGWAPKLFFTGEGIDQVLACYGITQTEADMSMHVALGEGAPLERLHPLRVATSTFEEAEAIRQEAGIRHQDTIIVVTTEFHTRRVKGVFAKAFADSGVTVLVHGASSMRYDAKRWWDSEEGLIMVNNEYMKLLYYALMH
jgi:uncharacterized SAM-binding protein YcdF (DUF218 family)